MKKSTKAEMMDSLVEAIPNIYKDVPCGMLLLEYGKRREKTGKRADAKYFKWLYQQFRKEVKHGYTIQAQETR